MIRRILKVTVLLTLRYNVTFQTRLMTPRLGGIIIHNSQHMRTKL